MNDMLPDSFSAFKAFRDYLEAERAGARRRAILWSLFCVLPMVVAMAGLITAGIFVFEKMARQQEAAARTQDLLLQTLLRQRAATLVPAPSASVEPESRPMADALQTCPPVMPPAVSAQPPVVSAMEETAVRPLPPVVVSAVEETTVRPQPAACQLQTHQGEARPVRNEEPATTHPGAIVATPPAREPPAEVATAPGAPLELPPEGHTRPAPLEGYVEDAIAIPSRVSGDTILWRLLAPAP